MNKTKKIANPRVVVCGCGSWGKNLVRNFHQLGALAGVHDLKPDVSGEIAAAHNIPSLGFDEVLKDGAIHGIVIASPAVHHAGMARAALQAGKNVFVEKPLALNVSEAEELCRLAGDSGLVLMVGHLLQYHPAFEKLREIHASGVLGNIRYLYSHRLNLGKFRTEENILWSFAPHDISMILGLLGKSPESVSATGQCYLNPDIADVTTTHLKFSGGQAAHIFVSWLHPFKEQRLVVVGEKGMVVFDDTQDWPEKISIIPDPVTWDNGVPTAAKVERQAMPLEEAEPLNLECRHFLDCMESGLSPRTGGEEGVRVLRVLDAAQRSMETGKNIVLKI